jgi:hypothetical protein
VHLLVPCADQTSCGECLGDGYTLLLAAGDAPDSRVTHGRLPGMPQTEYRGQYVRDTGYVFAAGVVVDPLVGCSSLGSEPECLLDGEGWEMH